MISGGKRIYMRLKEQVNFYKRRMNRHCNRCSHHPGAQPICLHWMKRMSRVCDGCAGSGNSCRQSAHRLLSLNEGCQIYGRILYMHIHRLAWNYLLGELYYDPVEGQDLIYSTSG